MTAPDKRREGEASEIVFEPETIELLVELGEVLRRIHNRLIAEGYTIENGHITPPKTIQIE